MCDTAKALLRGSIINKSERHGEELADVTTTYSKSIDFISSDSVSS
jgi:hypothetical protein